MEKRETVIGHLREKFGSKALSRGEIRDACEEAGFSYPRWIFREDTFKVGRGKYSFGSKGAPANSAEKKVAKVTAPAVVKAPASDTTIQQAVEYKESLVPSKDPLFVEHGEFKLLHQIITSKQFYPVFITGLSGNGKTFAVEQACAKAKRELFRVNITIETDEDDLLGGFRLVNDCTKWFDGPVVRAMKSGGVLLLDEVDLASTKILCLQPVLEGNGILLKKINQFVKPAPGFTIVATANTKGQGSESGKFVGTNILNEAFLERFCGTFEQQYPTEAVEKKILGKLFDNLEIGDSHTEDFATKLVTWAFATRKTYEEGGVSDLISTRRLAHIARAYAILGHNASATQANMGKNRLAAISLCVARFDESTRAAFLALYENLDVYVNPELEATPEKLSEEPAAGESTDGEDIVSILGTNI